MINKQINLINYLIIYLHMST